MYCTGRLLRADPSPSGTWCSSSRSAVSSSPCPASPAFCPAAGAASTTELTNKQWFSRQRDPPPLHTPIQDDLQDPAGSGWWKPIVRTSSRDRRPPKKQGNPRNFAGLVQQNEQGRALGKALTRTPGASRSCGTPAHLGPVSNLTRGLSSEKTTVNRIYSQAATWQHSDASHV